MSMPALTPPRLPPPRFSATTGRSSPSSPSAPACCTWAPRTTAGSPTRPGHSASGSPATRPPTGPSSECVTPPAARRRPTTPATGPSGPSVGVRVEVQRQVRANVQRRRGLPVVWPSAVGYWGVGAVAEFGLLGAGGEGGGDVVPAVAVIEGDEDVLGEHALGLVDEAGDQRDGGEGVAEPLPAALGELVEGVVDEVVGIVAAVRAGGGHGGPALSGGGQAVAVLMVAWTAARRFLSL